jgi:Fe-S cluster assembly scaffold protein SufB
MDLCYIPKAFASQWNFHFRINARVQDNWKNLCRWSSYVSYLEGCTAPSRDENHCTRQ